VCVCAGGGDETERRGKVREMEMFWREIFAEFVHVIMHTVLLQHVTITDMQHAGHKQYCRGLCCGQFCVEGNCLNDGSSSSLVRRVPPECVFRIRSVNSAFSHHEPKHIFGFLPDMLFVANYI
jgi:hypothetical protein